MARELVNLSTENEKLKGQTLNYPKLNEKYKVNKNFLWKFFYWLYLGIRKTL